LYSVNLTGRADLVVERAKKSLDQGANALKIDVLAAGFPALQALAEYVRKDHAGQVPIFVYPAMYKVYEQIDRRVLLQLSRLAGADIIYAGTPEVGTVDVIERAVTLRQYHYALMKDIPSLKSTMPSVAGGLHPGKVEFVKMAVGHNDFAYFIGGGIAGHQEGVKSGASLFAKAIKAFHLDGKTGSDPFSNGDIKAMGKSEWEPEEITHEMRERANYLQPPR
jgi:2,3-diketo-5-methylthiopentyl-1-phosphate enolase